MLVQRDRLLIALGCEIETTTAPFPCPMHPHTEPSLKDMTDSSITTFYCEQCKFHGDALALVTKARGLKSPDEALQLFLPGAELSSTLQFALSETQLKSYLKGRQSQVLIQEYIRRCHDALNSVTGQRLLAELTRGRCLYRKIPPTLGLMQTTYTPPGLQQLAKGVYKHDIFGIYAYEYDATITAITLQAAHQPHNETIALTPEQRGVYLDSCIDPDPEYILVAQDVTLATELYAISEYYSAKPYPVVAVRGYPLPHKYRTLKTIYMLSTQSSPLTLVTAIKAYAAPQLVSGVTYRPTIRVISTTEATLDPASLMRPDKQSMHIEYWIAQQLHQHQQQFGMGAVYRLLQSLPAFGENTDIITSTLQQVSASEELITCIKKHQTTYNKRVLTNDNIQVYSTTTGYLAAREFDTEPTIQLSNFTFDINQILYRRKRKSDAVQTIYRCTIKPENQQPLTMILYNSAFISAYHLRDSIITGYIEAGYPVPIIKCSDAGKTTWYELRDLLQPEQLIPEQVVDTLGISDNLALELPYLTILPQGTKIITQNKMIKYDAITDVYQGIRPFKWQQKHLQPFYDLWQMSTTGGTAIAACISHLVYCILAGMAHRKINRTMLRHHLLITDMAPEIWEPILKQFMYIISGSTKLLQPPYGCERSWFRSYARLGDLPAPVIMSKNTITAKCKRIMDDASCNWVALVNNVFAKAVNGFDAITYLSLPNNTKNRVIDILPTDILLNIQAALPELLQCIINQAWDIDVDVYNASTNHVLDTYKFIGNILTSPMSDCADKLLHTEYRLVLPKLLVMPNHRYTSKIKAG